jgi:hypothetical protein
MIYGVIHQGLHLPEVQLLDILLSVVYVDLIVIQLLNI